VSGIPNGPGHTAIVEQPITITNHTKHHHQGNNNINKKKSPIQVSPQVNKGSSSQTFMKLCLPTVDSESFDLNNQGLTTRLENHSDSKEISKTSPPRDNKEKEYQAKVPQEVSSANEATQIEEGNRAESSHEENDKDESNKVSEAEVCLDIFTRKVAPERVQEGFERFSSGDHPGVTVVTDEIQRESES
jgi:hypothetical protein